GACRGGNRRARFAADDDIFDVAGLAQFDVEIVRILLNIRAIDAKAMGSGLAVNLGGAVAVGTEHAFAAAEAVLQFDIETLRGTMGHTINEDIEDDVNWAGLIVPILL